MSRQRRYTKSPRKRVRARNWQPQQASKRFALFDEVSHSFKAGKNATQSVKKQAPKSWVTDAEVAAVMRGPGDNRGAKSGYIPYQEIACDRRVRDEENRRRGFDNRLKQFYQQSGFKLVDGELDVK